MRIRAFFTATLIATAQFMCSCSSTDTPSSNGDTQYSVSGKVTSTPSSTITQGVTITLDSRSTTTDANSAYSFDSVTAGSHVVTPILPCRTFTPLSKTISVSNSDVSGVDFDLDPASTIPPDSIQMVLIQPGSFMMGNDSGVPEFDVVAMPKHKVTISKSFYVGIHEVTQAQWMKVMSENKSDVVGDALPVTNVISDSIIIFCNRMSTLHGLVPVYTGLGKNVSIDYNATGYRLLTEAEWEYAASAGDQSLFYDVDDPTPVSSPQDSIRINSKISEYAWWAYNLGDAQKLVRQPVGTRKANAWGLFDMIGNVWELVEDNHQKYEKDDAVDPVYLPVQTSRVMRGGESGYVEWKFLTLRKRMPNSWNRATTYLGFRVARK